MSQLTLTSSAESADLPSPRNGRDSEPSPSAKSTSIARKSLPETLWPTPSVSGDGRKPKPDWVWQGTHWKTGQGKKVQTDLFKSVAYMETSSTSTEAATEAATCSQADFLASLSALPGSDEARQMIVRSGRRCSALLAKRDPLGCLARTFLESSRWNSTTCYLTWKESATPVGRLLFRLVPSMPGTDETDCGLLPTWLHEDQSDKFAPSEIFPTPTKEGFDAQGHRGTTDTLHSRVKQCPTPQARDYKGSSGRSIKGQETDLPTFVNAFPTPTSRDWKDNGQSPAELERNSTTLATIAGGSLNPTWVEWLMGYPIGWTDLKDSGTQSCRRSPSKSCEKSGN